MWAIFSFARSADCPSCGSASVRRSRRNGIVEFLLHRFFFISPYRWGVLPAILPHPPLRAPPGFHRAQARPLIRRRIGLFPELASKCGYRVPGSSDMPLMTPASEWRTTYGHPSNVRSVLRACRWKSPVRRKDCVNLILEQLKNCSTAGTLLGKIGPLSSPISATLGMRFAAIPALQKSD